MLSGKQRGDTLIEVILGLTILGLVTVSMFAIMQRGTASAYDALERSQVRMVLNSQTELLNYLRDSYLVSVSRGITPVTNSPGDIWKRITDTSPAALIKDTTTIPDLSTCAPTGVETNFYLAKSGGGITLGTSFTAATGAPEPGKGLWIQRADPPGYNGLNRKFHDFYILACWKTTTSNTQTLSTIVRLYDQN